MMSQPTGVASWAMYTSILHVLSRAALLPRTSAHPSESLVGPEDFVNEMGLVTSVKVCNAHVHDARLHCL